MEYDKTLEVHYHKMIALATLSKWYSDMHMLPSYKWPKFDVIHKVTNKMDQLAIELYGSTSLVTTARGMYSLNEELERYKANKAIQLISNIKEV